MERERTHVVLNGLDTACISMQPEEADELLERLEAAFSKIHRGACATLSFEPTYRSAYRLTLAGMGRAVYNLTVRFLEKMANSAVERAIFEERARMACDVVLFTAATFCKVEKLPSPRQVAAAVYDREDVRARRQWRRAVLQVKFGLRLAQAFAQTLRRRYAPDGAGAQAAQREFDCLARRMLPPEKSVKKARR